MNHAYAAAHMLWNDAGLDPGETLYGYTRDQYGAKLEAMMLEHGPICPRIHYCSIDCGDGSAYPAIFANAQDAEERYRYECDVVGQAFCEGPGSFRVGIDINGNVVSGTDEVGYDD